MKDTDGLLAAFAGRADVEMVFSREHRYDAPQGLRAITSMPNLRAIEFIAGEYGVTDDTIPLLANCAETYKRSILAADMQPTQAIQRLKTKIPTARSGHSR